VDRAKRFVPLDVPRAVEMPESDIRGMKTRGGGRLRLSPLRPGSSKAGVLSLLFSAQNLIDRPENTNDNSLSIRRTATRRFA
jgi:hypothetical protein